MLSENYWHGWQIGILIWTDKQDACFFTQGSIFIIVNKGCVMSEYTEAQLGDGECGYYCYYYWANGNGQAENLWF